MHRIAVIRAIHEVAVVLGKIRRQVVRDTAVGRPVFPVIASKSEKACVRGVATRAVRSLCASAPRAVGHKTRRKSLRSIRDALSVLLRQLDSIRLERDEHTRFRGLMAGASLPRSISADVAGVSALGPLVNAETILCNGRHDKFARDLQDSRRSLRRPSP